MKPRLFDGIEIMFNDRVTSQLWFLTVRLLARALIMWPYQWSYPFGVYRDRNFTLRGNANLRARVSPMYQSVLVLCFFGKKFHAEQLYCRIPM